MGRRRRGGGEALVVLAVIGALALAAISVYFIVAGAVAFIAWLVREVSRASANRQAKLVRTTEPPLVPPEPRSEYAQLVDVDAAAFDDLITAEAAALKVFTAWGRRLPAAPRDVDRFVHTMQMRSRLVGRLTSVVDGRRIVWRRAPYGGREAVGAAPFDVRDLDPWTAAPSLRDDSRYVESCGACLGDGEVNCPSCGGSTRVGCTACDGAGKIYGYAKNGSRRLLNCKGCRGKGTLKCAACRRGQVDCPTCHATGKLECWAEIEESRRHDVQIEPDADVTKAFRWGKDGVAATRDEVAADAKILQEVAFDRAVAAQDVVELVGQDWLDKNWTAIQPKLGRGERVAHQAFAFLEIPAVEVAYGIGDVVHAIELEGLRLLAPPATTDAIFRARAERLRNAAIMLAVVPVTVAIVYGVRGPFFVDVVPAAVVGALLAAAGCAFVALWQSSLNRGSARACAWACVVPLACAVVGAVVAEPNAERARRKLEAGGIEQARSELLALGAEDDAARAALWADVRLAEMRTASLAELEVLAEKIPPSLDQRVAAQTLVDAALVTEARRLLGAHDPRAAKTTMSRLSGAARGGADVKQLHVAATLALGRQCIEREEWECAFSEAAVAEAEAPEDGAALRKDVVAALKTSATDATKAAREERDVARRVEKCKGAEAKWKTLANADASAGGGGLKEASRDREAAERTLAAKLLAEERQRRAAEAKQRAEEEATRRKEEARQRRLEWLGRPVRCCDGSYSPSCTCGSNGRGCCSRHGGVCGGC